MKQSFQFSIKPPPYLLEQERVLVASGWVAWLPFTHRNLTYTNVYSQNCPYYLGPRLEKHPGHYECKTSCLTGAKPILIFLPNIQSTKLLVRVSFISSQRGSQVGSASHRDESSSCFTSLLRPIQPHLDHLHSKVLLFSCVDNVEWSRKST